MILPFAALLGAIAVMPLVAHAWWERHYPKVTAALSLVTLGYYLGALRDFHRPLESAHDYVGFICLTVALFTVSGGILIRVKGSATPAANTMMLALGAVLANLIGTTGASMVLIRPWLRANKYRLTAHHVVFFIFIVSNVGGSLTPIGDPPLYLGFLKGIPFFWTLRALSPMWVVGIAWLLAVFFIVDTLNYRRAPQAVRERETASETFRVEGWTNIAWIGLILGSLFIERPMFLREAIMVAAAVGSCLLTDPRIHEANDFSWKPAREVAILFAGIFVTMMPALDWLDANASGLGLGTTASFYWGTGVLSSVLDNAPTYLSFLTAATSQFVDPSVQGTVPRVEALLAGRAGHVAAISAGAVFFGAFTYIGNGPNFMVKSIAEAAGARTPSFFGYVIGYAVPFLLPMLVAVGWIFFRAP